MWPAMLEPQVKRAVAFFDGQNLFHAAKEAFGYTFPNFDPVKLALAVCRNERWDLHSVRFYTGMPGHDADEFWHAFWSAKLASLGRQKVFTFSRPLRYQNQTVFMPDGSQRSMLIGQEKGVDVRIALDVVGLARRGMFDVALVFSQDQDLSEVAVEIREVAREHDRWIKMASAFPSSPTSRNKRGINSADWIRIDRATYDACVDRFDYRPKKRVPG